MVKNKGRKNVLEGIYKDIKTGKITEDSIQNEFDNLMEQKLKIDEEHKRISWILENRNQEGMSELYNKSPEEMQNRLKELENKKLEIEGKIDSLEKRRQNVEAYSKNSTQIEKIIEYKKARESRIKSLKSEIRAGKKEITELRKTKKEQSKELSGILKQLEITDDMGMDEYKSLCSRRDEIKSNIPKLEEKIESIKRNNVNKEAEIQKLEQYIAKCDLAWKTLFVGKDWDEIQRRAISDKKRFIKSKAEKEATKTEKEEENEKEAASPAEATLAEEKVSTPAEEVPVEENTKIEKIFNDDDEIEEEETALTEIPKESRLKRFWEGVKRVAAKIKDFFAPVNDENENTVERNNVAIIDNPTEDGKENIEEAKNEIVKESVEEPVEAKEEALDEITESLKDEKAESETEKDVFLEGLRIRVDDNYKLEIQKRKEKNNVKENDNER